MAFCSKCGNKLKPEERFCPKCGTPVLPTEKNSDNNSDDIYKTQLQQNKQVYGVVNLEQLPAGHIIDDRYEVIEKIGQGGFGAVYRVYDKNMNIEKALKIIPEAMAQDKEAMFDIQKESQTMIKLNHPNIVRVYDFHQSGVIKYIDMEFVDGKTLTEIKLEHRNKQIPENIVKKYALQIAQGLAFSHSNSVIHRDLKPANVMINKDNKVKIMDFGIAETVRTSMSRLENSTSSGTLVYMSPEQIKGKNVGKEADIYAFGAMIYELLSGHPPFYKGDINYQILNEKPSKLENVSDKMNELIFKCLEKNYKNRYRDFEEIVKQLGGKFVNGTFKQSVIQPINNTQSSKFIKTLTTVFIQTNPDGATIYFDDNKKGFETPFKQKLSVGKHKLKIIKEGYSTIEDEIVISENSSNEFLIELESIMGSITVETEISGMDIWLNGENTQEKTPFTLENIIPNKKYEIYIYDKKYYSEKITVQIKDNQDFKIRPKLIQYSFIEFETLYKVEFNIDGFDIKENKKMKLPFGKYVVFTNLKYLKKFEINLKEGENKIIDFDELIPKRNIKIITNKYAVNSVFINSLTKFEDKLENNTNNLVLPGKGILHLKNKILTKNTKITSDTEDVVIDFDKEIKNKEIENKNKKKIILSLAIIAIFLTMVFKTLSIIKENKSWELAQKDNITYSYNEYLNKYPQGKHSEEAYKIRRKAMEIFVKGGTFQMGSNNGDSDGKPVHKVTISDFYISKYEVTQKEWQEIIGTSTSLSNPSNDSLSNPSKFKGENRPVESISWYDAIKYCNLRSEKEGLTPCYSGIRDDIVCDWTANGYRLPTEAEWEYAARGGSTGSPTKYAGSNNIDEVAWYDVNSGYKTHAVGSKKPNELGIYDMSGNVWEWCWDRYGSDYYDKSPENNPKGPNSGESSVLRGGSWFNYDADCRVAFRVRWGNSNYGYSHVGFRFARTP